MAPPRSVNETRSKRPLPECPTMISRRSRSECTASSWIRAKGSSKIVRASQKDTRCLMKLLRAFEASHVNRQSIALRVVLPWSLRMIRASATNVSTRRAAGRGALSRVHGQTHLTTLERKRDDMDLIPLAETARGHPGQRLSDAT